MKKIHLVHIIPDHLHIFHGYDEIIETIQWGLVQLGCTVSHSVERFEQNCTNIIFGAQMLSLEDLKSLPANTIIYNLEQMAGLKPEEIRESYKYCASNFQIWDYSEFNMLTWNSLNPKYLPLHIPIGYAPILTRIIKPENQDIDVLFYGGTGGQRLQIFNTLCHHLVKTVFVHGLYGKARDNLISNSKIIINITQFPQHGIFEIARASYLLANSKAIVSDFSAYSKIEPDIQQAIKFCSVENVVQECINLLDNTVERKTLEDNGFNIMSKRDIRQILKEPVKTL
jgi:hypothetical protein